MSAGSTLQIDPAGALACVWCGTEAEGGRARCACDLRIECGMGGRQGHERCGWCDAHAAPRFACRALHAADGSEVSP